MTKAELEALGWSHNPADGFLAVIGGYWERSAGGRYEFGFVSADMHKNRNSVVHGGMLMTFMDRALGQTARNVSGAVRSATISLNVNFISPMPIGVFASMAPTATKITRRLAFMDGTVLCGDEVLATVQGVWRLATTPAGEG